MKKAIASASLLALGTGVVLAQGSAPPAPMEPYKQDKIWSVSAALRGFYDDNVYTSEFPRVDSFGFEVRPAGEVHLNLPQTTLKASYQYGIRYYGERPDNKYDQNHDFEFFLNHDFSERYSLDVSDSFIISQEPEVGLVTFPFRSNGNNLHNVAAINFHAQLTRLMGVVVGYANSLYDYEEQAGDSTVPPGQPSRSALLDRVEHLFTFDSTWKLSENTTGILGFKYGMVDYQSTETISTPTVIFIPATVRNNHSYFGYLGADQHISSDLSATWRVGVQYHDYYNAPAGALQNDLSPYVVSSITYSYRADGTVSAGFQYLHNQTDQAFNLADPTAGITMDQSSAVLFANVVQRLAWLSPDLTGTLSGQYQNSTFNGGPSDGEADNIYTVGLNLVYQINHYLSTDFGYNYDMVSSKITGRGYDRNRLYLGVTATY
jgi:Putative beta-barrel porin 2